MTQQELSARDQRAKAEPFVVRQTEAGFLVYSPAAPSKSYVVGGDAESPTCTCPDSRFHGHEPSWRCKHVLAVYPQPASGNGHGPPITPPTNGNGYGGHGGATLMLLKRSVSPDRRIDSLSVEFSCPVAAEDAGEVVERALCLLSLQAGIVDHFLGAGGTSVETHSAPPPAAPTATNGDPMPATLLDVAGINTRWGRRTFINVAVNGETVRLFGNGYQLSAAVVAAGFPDRARNLCEGMPLNLPCRVITQPNKDGRYTNVVAVMPAMTVQQGRSAPCRPPL